MEVPLLLVDGHNLLFRAVFGFPAPVYSRDKSRDLTGLFGFFALLKVAIRDELTEPPEVVVVFDGENGSTARKQTDQDYKAHRPADEQALKPIRALPEVKRGLDAYGISWIEIDDAEADDVIATLIHTTPGRQRLIMSMDKDFYQLLDIPGVRILNTAMRPGNRIIGADHVRQRHGVTPSQWPSFRALTGDPSDNIPGVCGIGPKTAATLLADDLAVGDLPSSDRLTGTKGHRILAALPQILTWHDLIEARTDIPLPATLDANPSPTLPKPAEVIEKLGLW